jgi:hypothetical protein
MKSEHVAACSSNFVILFDASYSELLAKQLQPVTQCRFDLHTSVMCVSQHVSHQHQSYAYRTILFPLCLHFRNLRTLSSPASIGAELKEEAVDLPGVAEGPSTTTRALSSRHRSPRGAEEGSAELDRR